jgi:peptidoglycan/xylan/chitin deacetylase (PgdA/CDA1 family)
MKGKMCEKIRQIFMIVVLMNILLFGYNVSTNQPVSAYVHSNGNSEGILLYNFTTNAGWKNGSPGLNVTNTTFHTEGTGSLRITAVGGATYWLWRTCSWNFSSAENIGIDIYCANTSEVQQLGIHFSSESNSSWTKQASLGLKAYLDIGWNRLSLNKSAFTLNDGESWANTMVKFRLQLDPVATTATAYVDNLRINYTGFPKVIITHDGNYNGIDSLAEPILDYYGFNAVRFVENFTIGTAGQTTLANLTRQYNKGWDISNHGEKHLDTVTLNATTLDREVNLCYFWLIAHGFIRSAKFYCYPFGHYNDAVVTTVMEHHVMARDSTTGKYEKHYTASEVGTRRMYQLKGVTVTNTTPLATVMDDINSTLTTNGVLVLIFHTLSTASGTLPVNTWNATNYNRTMSLLKTYQTANKLDVVTLSEYYGELTSAVESSSNNTVNINEVKTSSKTPGFEFVFVICAIAVSILLWRKKGIV